MHKVSFSFLLVNLVLLSKWTSLSEVLINHLKRQHLLFSLKVLKLSGTFSRMYLGSQRDLRLRQIKKD